MAQSLSHRWTTRSATAAGNIAFLLIHHGARVKKSWQAAVLGLLDRLEELLEPPAFATEDAVDQAFWHAYAGGQRRAAELLLGRGADLGFTPSYGHGAMLDVASGHGTQRTNVLEWLQQLGGRRSGD